jgi:hypothetical protein
VFSVGTCVLSLCGPGDEAIAEDAMQTFVFNSLLLDQIRTQGQIQQNAAAGSISDTSDAASSKLTQGDVDDLAEFFIRSLATSKGELNGHLHTRFKNIRIKGFIVFFLCH